MSRVLISFMVFLFVLIPLFVGSIFLQIVLSKNKNKFLGLILPIICFVMSLIMISSYAMFAITKTSVNVQSTDGVISTYVESENSKSQSVGNIGGLIYITVLFNIPTLIYLGIYFSYSKYRKEISNNKSNSELIKMNIQDLE